MTRTSIQQCNYLAQSPTFPLRRQKGGFTSPEGCMPAARCWLTRHQLPKTNWEMGLSITSLSFSTILFVQ